MSTHTKGPWIATTKPEHDHKVFFIHHDNGSGFLPVLEIATIYSGGNDNARADAQLIAECPKFYELASYLSFERNPNIYIAMDMAMRIIDRLHPNRDEGCKARESYEANTTNYRWKD